MAPGLRRLPKSIATVSLSGTLPEKLEAAAAVGFDGVEIFENDLLNFDGSPADVRRICDGLGLRIDIYQPFRDFEAMPDSQRQRNVDRAERKFDVMQALGTDLVLTCSNCLPNSIGRRCARGGRSRPHGGARGEARLAGRLRGAGLGAARQHLGPRVEDRAAGRAPGARASSWTASTRCR